ESEQGRGVRPGDIVVDVGAHIGTFGDDALRRGASRVIMVEPDPLNLECIRRNFRDEIAAGRVVVIPEGAWSKTDSLNFEIGVANPAYRSTCAACSSDRESAGRIIPYAVFYH